MRVVSCRFPYVSAGMLLCLMVGCVCLADSVRASIAEALSRCLTVIIPSLYAMMILSLLLTQTGIWQYLARPIRRLTMPLIGLPDGCFALLLLSQIAGYPVGAGMLDALTEQGILSKEDSQRLACVCYGSGPAFLLGLLGEGACRQRLFLLVFGAGVLSNLILAVFLFRRHPVILRSEHHTSLMPLTGDMLLHAATDAGQTLLRLCGIILCFSGILGLMQGTGLFQQIDACCIRAGLPPWGSSLLICLLEVTNTAKLSIPLELRLPFLAGALSFGGVCVLMQVSAAGGRAVSMKRLLPARLIAALLSAFLCALGLWCCPELKTAAEPVMASAAAVKYTHNAVFPSVMLLVMMLLLFREAGKEGQ